MAVHGEGSLDVIAYHGVVGSTFLSDDWFADLEAPLTPTTCIKLPGFGQTRLYLLAFVNQSTLQAIDHQSSRPSYEAMYMDCRT